MKRTKKQKIADKIARLLDCVSCEPKVCDQCKEIWKIVKRAKI